MSATKTPLSLDMARRVAERADLLAALGELRGKTLVCWCAPEACHGDVLRELLADMPDGA